MNNEHGDSTSQLVQITCKDVGFKFTASGSGAQDIRRIVCEAYNAQLVSKALWQMGADLAKAIDESVPPVDEKFKAIVCAGILSARSSIDLGKKQ